MRTFSERHGFIHPRKALQKDGIDARLRNRLWTVCSRVFWGHLAYQWEDSEFGAFVVISIQDKFLGQTLDDLPRHSSSVVQMFKDWAFKADWNEYYDFVQFLGDFTKKVGADPQSLQVRRHGEIFVDYCNNVLEAEKSAYWFVSGDLCEITGEVEISAIEDATKTVSQFATASAHIQKALSLYASREKPDYNNSVKEAISAIEATFSVINGEKAKNLRAAVKLAETKGVNLHPALKNGMLSLYGWTSDENGVRHAMFEDTAQLSTAQAKMMLVICSGLMNYLIVTHTERNT